MSEDYEANVIEIVDEEGNRFELEQIDSLEYEGEIYVAFLPLDMDFDDPDYGYVILKQIDMDDGTAEYENVESDELLNTIFEKFEAGWYEEEEEADEAEEAEEK